MDLTSKLAAWLLLASISAFISGYVLLLAVEAGSSAMVALFAGTLVVVLCLHGLAVRDTGVVFGSSEISPGVQILAILLGAILGSTDMLGNPAIVGEETAGTASIFVLPTGLYLITHLRGWALVPYVLFMAFDNYLLMQSVALKSVIGVSGANLFMLYALSLAAPTRYIRDQRLILLSIWGPAFTFFAGYYLAQGREQYAAINLIMASVCWVAAILYSRYKRVLPAPLQPCRFVRVGYLRTMRASCSLIRRLQDMPPEAFGDVEKASTLIITSHRWLDRYTCDVVTPDWPMGLRMASMLQRVGLSFPETLQEAFSTGFCSGLTSALASITTGGWDLLLFFDFMGLPQIGKEPDGTLIQRTEQETDIFYEALPLMGALYTMYDVLVIPEVSANVAGYFSSGWCTSELYSAMLAKRLGTYSSSAVQEYIQFQQEAGLVSDGTEFQALLDKVIHGELSRESQDEFFQHFTKDLATKTFFDEKDRQIVAGIVQSFLLSRLLFDSIVMQNTETFHQFLNDFVERGLTSTINQAVDPLLNTLLHHAVKGSSLEIIEGLLKAGADPNVQNLRGDTPTQLFGMPICSGGAQLCRKHYRSSLANTEDAQPLFQNCM